MPLRSYKPTSAGRRFVTRATFEEITTTQPHKPLLEAQQRTNGRNNQGRLTVRHRGGGQKQFYRRIDYRRDKWDVPAKLATVEYDPDVAGQGVEARLGNALPLKGIPLGTTIHNIEIVPGRGGQMVRSAGTSAQLLAKEGDYA